MIHKRIITLDGDEQWIKRTVGTSLPEGISTGFFGVNRKITVETIKGGIIVPDKSRNPQLRFEVADDIDFNSYQINILKNILEKSGRYHVVEIEDDAWIKIREEKER